MFYFYVLNNRYDKILIIQFFHTIKIEYIFVLRYTIAIFILQTIITYKAYKL